MKDLELGQMLFGNPTQEYPVPREKWMKGPTATYEWNETGDGV